MTARPRTPLIAPSILSADFFRLGDEISAVARAGADLIHIDVMDAHFVPNLTMGPPVIKKIRRAVRTPFDVHLMMTDPEKYLADFVKAGADYVTVHVESCGRSLPRIAAKIRRLGAIPGVAVNPETPFSAVRRYLSHFDLLLMMTVHPGFGGQSFMKSVVPKIDAASRWIRKNRPGMQLSVDGGIDASSASAVIRAGATVLVAGSAVFGERNYARAIQKLRAAK